MATRPPKTPNGQAVDVLRQIDERLQRLEEQVAALTKLLPREQQAEKPWWEKIAGTWKGNPVVKEVVREMRRRRREDYARVNAEIDAAEARDKARKKKARKA